MKINQLHTRYALPCDDRELDALFEIIPEPAILDFARLEVASRTLVATAASIFLMDDQRRAIVRRILGAAEALAAAAMADPVMFNRRLMLVEPWSGIPSYVLSISGLAGTGKTSMLDSIARHLIAQVSTIEFGAGIDCPARAFARLQASHGATLMDLLQSLSSLPDIDCSGDEQRPRALSAVGARKLLYKLAICLMFADELQEISASSTASAKVTKLLLRLASLCPVFAFGCNYSLLHKLASRNQEEKDRLLAHHVILRPYAAQSIEWRRYLEVLFTRFGKAFQIDLEKHADLLHGMTFGIHRKVVLLLEISLRFAKPTKGIYGVTIANIQDAFRSSEYSASRFEIEKLNRQLNSGRHVDKDLHSPFDPVDGLVERDDLQRANEERVRRLHAETEAQAQRSAMTAAERANDQAGQLAKALPSAAKPTSPRRPKRRIGDLAQTQALYENLR